MKEKSLRQLAREFGVSASYLSQVKSGKRSAKDKLLSKAEATMRTSTRWGDIKNNALLLFPHDLWRRAITE